MGQLGGGYRTGSSMLVFVVGMVTLVTLGQAYPTINLQGYTSVPAVPGIPTQNEALTRNSVSDTVEVEQAKQEFMTVFRQAMDGLLGDLAPKPVQDTREVREAKEEFFRIFDKALNGVIETVFIRDTEEVRARKEEFFGTFDSAVSNLISTVEENYLEDTSDVKAAKARFSQAFADAEAGKIGAQYLEDSSDSSSLHCQECCTSCLQFQDRMCYLLKLLTSISRTIPRLLQPKVSLTSYTGMLQEETWPLLWHSQYSQKTKTMLVVL